MIEDCYFIELQNNLNKKKQQRLTEYEQSIGFTEQTRVGSKYFNIYFGNFMHKIISNSSDFAQGQNGLDCQNDKFGIQIKSRHDTMKQSMAVKEIEPMIEYCHYTDRIFVLLIITDNKNCSRDIPLHQGSGLTKIRNSVFYNEDRMRWISGDELYKFIWKEEGNNVKSYILSKLSQLDTSK